MSALGSCSNLPSEKYAILLKTLQHIIHHAEDKHFRLCGAIALMRANQFDGLKELIETGVMEDETSGLKGLVPMLVSDAGEFFWSYEETKQWWEENKDRLKAEQTAADVKVIKDTTNQ